MNERQEILRKMARDVSSWNGGFEDLDVYETIEDLGDALRRNLRLEHCRRLQA